LKQNSAGGLGGMITGLENEELPLSNNFEIDQTKDQVSPVLLKGRVIAMWEPPQGAFINEKENS
jgi:hypothetical protein